MAIVVGRVPACSLFFFMCHYCFALLFKVSLSFLATTFSRHSFARFSSFKHSLNLATSSLLLNFLVIIGSHRQWHHDELLAVDSPRSPWTYEAGIFIFVSLSIQVKKLSSAISKVAGGTSTASLTTPVSEEA
jgi:hypothetical protein